MPDRPLKILAKAHGHERYQIKSDDTFCLEISTAGKRGRKLLWLLTSRFVSKVASAEGMHQVS